MSASQDGGGAHWAPVLVAVVTGITAIVVTLIQTGIFSGPEEDVEAQPSEVSTPTESTSHSQRPTPTVGPTTPSPPSSPPPEGTVIPLREPPPDLSPGDGPDTDWDGAMFDFGRPRGTIRLATGRVGLVYDRYTVTINGVVLDQATKHEREPVVAFYDPSVIQNQNPLTRSFELDPDVDVLVLANHETGCADPTIAPEWESGDLDLLADPPPGWLASLVYDDVGRIEHVRFTAGC